MLLSAVSVLVVAQSSSEIPEGLTNNPVEYNEIEQVRVFNMPHLSALARLLCGIMLVAGNF